jgi:hypothetical protein
MSSSPFGDVIESLTPKALKKKSKPAPNVSGAHSSNVTGDVTSVSVSATPQSATPNAVRAAPVLHKQAVAPSPNASQSPKSSPVQLQKTKSKRRPKNTVVVSLQMPEVLVKVLDQIVDAGAYRNRSDLILQAVRAHPDVSKRLQRLEPTQLPKK